MTNSESGDEAYISIDVEDERIWIGDETIKLTPKAYKLLRVLVKKKNQLVTKQEIINLVWPDTVVVDSLVKDYIQDLRKALSDKPKQPKFIETVHGRGYRFIGNVTEISKLSKNQNAGIHLPSIAILVFDNITNNSKWKRFAFGLCDDITTDLTRYPDLHVIARNSSANYPSANVDLKKIQAELDVNYVLFGSIQASDSLVRVTAKLTETSSDRLIWAERFEHDIENVFKIQDDVVEKVAASLGGYSGEIHRSERAKYGRKRPVNMRAYDLYLKGYEYEITFKKKYMLSAIDLLKQSIELDPHFSRSWTVLGWVYRFVALQKWVNEPKLYLKRREDAVREAFKLDPRDPIALVEYGNLVYESGNINYAREIFERAADLGRNDADALALLSIYIVLVLGQPDYGLELMNRALRLNPHAPSWYYMPACRVAYFASSYETALDAVERAIPTAPIQLFKILSLAQIGDKTELKESVKEFHEMYPNFDFKDNPVGIPLLFERDIALFQEGLAKAGLV